MAWQIDSKNEFNEWFKEVDEAAKEDIRTAIITLSEIGPTLGRPQVDTLNGSIYPNMKEFRVQSNGRPFRIAFAFDPKRRGILLCGGNKQGVSNFYGDLIKEADEIYTKHLKELEDEKAKSKKSSPKKKKR